MRKRKRWRRSSTRTSSRSTTTGASPVGRISCGVTFGVRRLRTLVERGEVFEPGSRAPRDRTGGLRPRARSPPGRRAWRRRRRPRDLRRGGQRLPRRVRDRCRPTTLGGRRCPSARSDGPASAGPRPPRAAPGADRGRRAVAATTRRGVRRGRSCRADRAHRRRRLSLPPDEVPRNPYRGLRAFTEADAPTSSDARRSCARSSIVSRTPDRTLDSWRWSDPAGAASRRSFGPASCRRCVTVRWRRAGARHRAIPGSGAVRRARGGARACGGPGRCGVSATYFEAARVDSSRPPSWRSPATRTS